MLPAMGAQAFSQPISALFAWVTETSMMFIKPDPPIPQVSRPD